MIIAIANSKGGVGKSTLSVHLAVWLHRRGHSVILADCDMQQSSSEWIKEAAPEVRSVVFNDPEAILTEFPALAQEAEFVIADGPGSHSESSRSLLLRADYAIAPCKASMLEVRALAKVTDAVRIAQDVRHGPPPAIVVLSMVRENYRLTQDMKDAADALSLRVAQTPVTLRQVYADSPGQATVVWNMGSRGRDAAAEIDVLFREIMNDIERNNVSPVGGEVSMVERRTLVEGMKAPPPPAGTTADPAKERDFVYGKKPTASASTVPERTPLNTRIRGDFARALKRASLERQLNGTEPSTLQEILEEALEPWMRSNGLLR